MSSVRITVRTRQLALALALCAGILLPGLAAAQAQDRWTVTEASGEAAQQAPAAQWIPLKAGDTLAEGAAVRTGADGRLVLARSSHKDIITASPGSQFTVPRVAAEATEPTILQTLGTLLFKVEHTPGRHFEVKGPYLAAVVKGTVFTVTIAADENVVHLATGSVEVTDSNTREIALLRPGQTARVPAAPGRPMTVIGALAPGTAQPSTTQAQADDGGQKITHTLGDVQLDVAALSNNLVRPTGNAGVTAGVSSGSSPSDGTAGAVTSMVSSATGATGSAASGTVSGATDAVDGTVATAASAVGNVASAATGTVGSTTSAVGGAVGGTVSAAGSVAGGTVAAVGNAASGALGAVGNTVGGSLGNTVSGVGNTVGNTVSSVGTAAGATVSAVGTTVGTTTSTVGSTVSSIGNTVAGLLGGTKNKLKLP